MDLVDEVYKLTELLPSTERFGLSSQVQRASVSVPANIAEGYGRKHRGDYLRFLSIARGSLCEVETLLLICIRRGYFSEERAESAWQFAQRVGLMLRKLMESLESRDKV